MTEAEKLNTVRILTSGSDTDEVLSVYLKSAAKKIINKAYPYDDTQVEVPEKYSMLQCEIAAYLLNKRGAEGQVLHMENGIQRSYENADVPSSLMNQIIPFCGVLP